MCVGLKLTKSCWQAVNEDNCGELHMHLTNTSLNTAWGKDESTDEDDSEDDEEDEVASSTFFAIPDTHSSFLDTISCFLDTRS